MKAEEGYVKVTGGKIWYKVFNKESKSTPLIVLHGGPGSSSHSLQTLHFLSTDRTIVFYDQLGCGKSDRSKDTKLWKKERFVSELEGLRKQLGFKEMHILGHSWGSMLAILYALKYPKRVKKLVFSGPFFSTARWINDTNKLKESLPKETQEIINKHEKEGTTNAKEYKKATTAFYKKFLCRIYPYPKPLQEGIKQAGKEVYNTMWGPTEFCCTGNLKKVDLTNRLHEVSIPVLLICGRYDMSTPKTTTFYKNKFPKAQMKVLEKSAHTMFLEQPEIYLQAVRSFLQK